MTVTESDLKIFASLTPSRGILLLLLLVINPNKGIKLLFLQWLNEGEITFKIQIKGDFFAQSS